MVRQKYFAARAPRPPSATGRRRHDFQQLHRSGQENRDIPLTPTPSLPSVKFRRVPSAMLCALAPLRFICDPDFCALCAFWRQKFFPLSTRRGGAVHRCPARNIESVTPVTIPPPPLAKADMAPRPKAFD